MVVEIRPEQAQVGQPVPRYGMITLNDKGCILR
jgi:hypothetical protein